MGQQHDLLDQPQGWLVHAISAATTTASVPRPARGFTLIEAAVVMAIMGIMLAIAMPSMSNWLLGRKAMGAAVFYQDGFTLARNTALAHNGHSRLVLTENAANGQMDWRVDLCFATTNLPCDSDDSAWSTVTATAPGDPNTNGAFKSVARSAGAMPGETELAEILNPSGAAEVYFTPLGWVDSVYTQHLTSITLQPSLKRANAFKPLAIVVTLAGIAAICDPSAALHDTRRCPPP